MELELKKLVLDMSGNVWYHVNQAQPASSFGITVMKKKVTIYVDEEQWKQLERIHSEIGVSKSEFIRRSLEDGLRNAMVSPYRISLDVDIPNYFSHTLIPL